MTKAQRHKYYKKALLGFNKNQVGLCSILSNVSRVRYDRILETFPEFSQKNPNPKKFTRMVRWWPFTNMGHKKRRTALRQFIKETASKTKTINK